MRIDRLALIAFGPFTDAALDLSGGSEGLHLVFGPNEAGKSSALRAVRQFFCGIPHQSTDNFLNHKEMRIGAALRGRAGATLELVRRKGTKNTLLGADGKAVDDADARLANLLGGVAAEEFLQKFVIDHAELVAGGKTVVEGGGDLGRVLFAAGSGLTGLNAAQKALDAEAEALFKRGGSKPQINARLAELDAGRKRLKESTLKSSEWLEHDEALRAALARNAALERDRDQAARERKRLQRLSDAAEPVARRAAVLDDLRALGDVPRLAAGFTDRRRTAESFLAPTLESAAKDERKISELTAELQSLDVPEPLLEQAGAITELQLRLGRHQKARADRVRLDAELAGFENEARTKLRDLGRDPALLDPDRSGALDALRHKAPDRAAVLELANERQALLQARDDARAALETHDARLQAVAARLAALGPGRDADALRKAVKRAQKPGDLDDLLDKERKALTREERRADNALKSLGLWSGPLDALEALAVPSAETIERFQAEFAEARTAIEIAQRLVVERETEARAAAEALDRLRLEGDVPTDDALAAARDARESAWDRLKVGWDARLVPAYERSVHDADEAADRLRREAQRVGEHARLVAERARLAAALDDLRARGAQAAAGLDAVQTRWSALWRPLEIHEPGAPREMLAWSRRAADLAALAGSIRDQSDKVRGLDAQRALHRRALGEALGALGEPSADVKETLADLIERAQETIDAIARESKARDRLKDDVEARKADHPARERAAATSRLAWDDWQARWAAAMARIGLAPDALPTEANTVLDLNAALFDRLDKARAHRHQIEAIARESRRFTTDVWSLADRVAPDLAIGDNRFDPEPAAVALTDRLGRARKAQQIRDDRTAQRAERERALETARDEIARLRGELAALRREAGCDTDDALPAIEERSARRQSLEKELADLNALLSKLAAGSPPDSFLAEAGRADPDGLALEIVRLDERIAAVEAERETVNQTIGAEQAQIKMMNGSPRGADAGQEAEDLRARIKTDVEQYARLRLASAVLRAGIERYRQKTQEPVLNRASALFSALTLGSFARLAVAHDDHDKPVLQGIRPGAGSDAVGVSGMSLGAADQLYLALRLATLETYLDRREPLPLVVDDVLIQFDNARARATLSALATLSKRTQVLVFTHHEHLLDLASAVVPPDLLFLHRLPGPVSAKVI